MDRYEILKQDPKSHFDSKTFEVTLTKRQPISPDSYIFTFQLPDENERIMSLVTEHVIIYGQNVRGETIRRKYTVTSPFLQKGSFDIPIKIYRPNTNPYYPDGGELTPWLEKLELGSKILVKRALGKLIYLSNGQAILKPKDNNDVRKFHTILMTCGGTGITPIFQLIQEICNDPNDKTRLFLLFANRTEADILLRESIDAYAAQHPNKLTVFYTIDKKEFQQQSDGDWKYYLGHVSLEMMKKSFPAVDEMTIGTLCGPKGFNKLVVQLYKDLGLKEANILKF